MYVIESLTCNSTQDFLYAWGSTDSNFLFDLTMTVTVLSTSHSLVHHQSVVNRPVVVGGVGTGKQLECGENGSVFERHSKTVTSLFFSFFSFRQCNVVTLVMMMVMMTNYSDDDCDDD